MIRIRFARDHEHAGVRILAHCEQCNSEEEITLLVTGLTQYGLESCPGNLYTAWKVLVMGTKDYAESNGDLHSEHRIIVSALRAVGLPIQNNRIDPVYKEGTHGQ